MVSVLSGPATGAVEITGRGGVQQNRPGHVATLPLLGFVLNSTAFQAGVIQEVLEKDFSRIGVKVVHL